MEEQSEALRLADLVDHGSDSSHIEREVAAELRRLHALNGELLEALKRIVGVDACSVLTEAEADEIQAKARAAIAKAEGEQA